MVEVQLHLCFREVASLKPKALNLPDFFVFVNGPLTSAYRTVGTCIVWMILYSKTKRVEEACQLQVFRPKKGTVAEKRYSTPIVARYFLSSKRHRMGAASVLFLSLARQR